MTPLHPAWLWLLAVTVLLLLWLLGARSRLNGLRQRIGLTWRPLADHLDRELAAQAALHSGVAATLSGERAALEAQAQARDAVHEAFGAVRRRPAQPEGMAELAQAVTTLQAVGQRLQARVAHEAALVADPAVAEALRVLQAVPAERQFLKQAFNEAVTAYNQALAQWPTRWLRPLLRMEPAGPY